jgi:hypothetical protein
MMVVAIIQQSNADGLQFFLHGEGDIRIFDDQSKIVQWLPVIEHHKQEIIKQLTERDNYLETIRQWLFQIGEPEENRHLVMDRCKADPQVLEYYLKHASGEFVSSEIVTDARKADDRILCPNCIFLLRGNCQTYVITNHGVRYDQFRIS